MLAVLFLGQYDNEDQKKKGFHFSAMLNSAQAKNFAPSPLETALQPPRSQDQVVSLRNPKLLYPM